MQIIFVLNLTTKTSWEEPCSPGINGDLACCWNTTSSEPWAAIQGTAKAMEPSKTCILSEDGFC